LVPAHGLSQVFRHAEFRALWAAELLSIVGDQLARVGLAVLVYGRTGSAAWAALTYALTFLPAMAGGVLLGRLADRYRRRELMVLADLLRAGLVGLMALPGLPLWLLCALLVVVVAVGPPHAAAQGALLPEVLGPRFEAGLAVRQITSQAGQLAGFALGGAALAVVSPSVALGADALTFAISAVLLRYGLRDRPVAEPGAARAPSRPPRPARRESRAGRAVGVRVGRVGRRGVAVCCPSGTPIPAPGCVRCRPTRAAGCSPGWCGWSAATWCRRAWRPPTRRSSTVGRPWSGC
jgi:MFS family permease